MATSLDPSDPTFLPPPINMNEGIGSLSRSCQHFVELRQLNSDSSPPGCHYCCFISFCSKVGEVMNRWALYKEVGISAQVYLFLLDLSFSVNKLSRWMIHQIIDYRRKKSMHLLWVQWVATRFALLSVTRSILVRSRNWSYWQLKWADGVSSTLGLFVES